MWRVAAAISALAAASPAAAHSIEKSFVDLRPTPTGAQLMFDFDTADFAETAHARLDLDESGQVEDGEMERQREILTRYALAGVVVWRGGERCETALAAEPAFSQGMVRAHLVATCATEGRYALHVPLLETMRRGHRTFATVRLDTGIRAVALSSTQPGWEEPPEPTVWSESWRFFGLGVEHILLGYDHLLFLFALLLVRLRFRDLAVIVTSFTVAHSITLVGAGLGAFSLPSAIVEPAIALTILYVGLENFFIKKPSRRWVLTFALGLIHGFGFAGLLAEIGLPKTGTVPALLSFNVGVEVGQLAMVAVVVPALTALRADTVSTRARVAILTGAALAAAALYPFELWAAVFLLAFAAVAVALVPRLGFRRVVLQGGSGAVIALGALWFVLRVV
jgi:hydrogenase/urease accessory protein HupE